MVVEQQKYPQGSDIGRVMSWFENDSIILDPVARNMRAHLDILYQKLGGTDKSPFRKQTLIEKAREMLEIVADLSVNGSLEPEMELAFDYALRGESKLIDILLEGKKGKYVRSVKALSHLVYVSWGSNGTDRLHIPAAALLIAQEIIESEQNPTEKS